MIFLYHERFEKSFSKLPKKVQDSFLKRQELFASNPYHATLNNHSVEAVYPCWRSINITGDYRALFEVVDDSVVFMRIGTHAELYR